jgi:hypothetical protein
VPTWLNEQWRLMAQLPYLERDNRTTAIHLNGPSGVDSFETFVTSPMYGRVDW